MTSTLHGRVDLHADHGSPLLVPSGRKVGLFFFFVYFFSNRGIIVIYCNNFDKIANSALYISSWGLTFWQIVAEFWKVTTRNLRQVTLDLSTNFSHLIIKGSLWKYKYTLKKKKKSFRSLASLGGAHPHMAKPFRFLFSLSFFFNC